MEDNLYVIRLHIASSRRLIKNIDEAIEMSSDDEGKGDLRLVALQINALRDYGAEPEYEVEDFDDYRGFIKKHWTKMPGHYVIYSYDIFPTKLFEAIQNQGDEVYGMAIESFTDDDAFFYLEGDMATNKICMPDLKTKDGLPQSVQFKQPIENFLLDASWKLQKKNLENEKIWIIREVEDIPSEHPKGKAKIWDPVKRYRDEEFRISNETLQEYFPNLYQQKIEQEATERAKRLERNASRVKETSPQKQPDEKKPSGCLPTLWKVIKIWFLIAVIAFVLLVLAFFL